MLAGSTASNLNEYFHTMSYTDPCGRVGCSCARSTAAAPPAEPVAPPAEPVALPAEPVAPAGSCESPSDWKEYAMKKLAAASPYAILMTMVSSIKKDLVRVEEAGHAIDESLQAFIGVGIFAGTLAGHLVAEDLESRGLPNYAAILVIHARAQPTYRTLFTLKSFGCTRTLKDLARQPLHPDIIMAVKTLI